jgi:hypothetical protein
MLSVPGRRGTAQVGDTNRWRCIETVHKIWLSRGGYLTKEANITGPSPIFSSARNEYVRGLEDGSEINTIDSWLTEDGQRWSLLS